MTVLRFGRRCCCIAVVSQRESSRRVGRTDHIVGVSIVRRYELERLDEDDFDFDLAEP
jgi:hypothetical protein